MTNRDDLNNLLDGVTDGHIASIRKAAKKWTEAATQLTTIANKMPSHAKQLAKGFGDNATVSDAADKAFTAAKKHMLKKSDQMTQSASKLQTVATTLQTAKLANERYNEDDQVLVPSTGKPQNHEANEKAAGTHASAVKTAFNDAITQLKTVDELPATKPPTGGGSGGSTGGGSGTPSVPPPTSTKQPKTTEPPTTITFTPTHTSTTPVHHTVPGTNPGTNPGTDPGTNPGTDPWRTTGTTGDGGLLQGGGTPMPSGPTSVPTQVPAAPAASAVTQGTASGYGAGADVLGAGAGAGALGGYGAGGAGGAALRFTPGQAIGGTTPTARTGAGFLGTEEETALGRRTVVATGGGANGGVGATGSGAGGARGGGRGSAGSSRAGATAGGRGGRDRKRGEQGPDDLWDDGSDWIDDEGAGPSVMR